MFPSDLMSPCHVEEAFYLMCFMFSKRLFFRVFIVLRIFTVAWFTFRSYGGFQITSKPKNKLNIFLIVSYLLVHDTLHLPVLLAAPNVLKVIFFVPFKCDNYCMGKLSLFFYTVLPVQTFYSRQSNIVALCILRDETHHMV